MPKLKKDRLDNVLLARGLAENLHQAQGLVMAGDVFVDQKKIDKPGFSVLLDAEIRVKQKPRYVSRAGFKLAKGLEVFHPSVKGKTCLDIGAATGGFTDCLLQAGASKVYAVDVAYNKLHEKLQVDSRVIYLRRVNARYLSEKEIPEKIDFVVCDVSFISMLKIFAQICDLLAKKAEGIVLIKPQFELSREEIRHGVVRDPQLHIKAILEIVRGLENLGFAVRGVDFSEKWGPKGNIEFLAYISLQEGEQFPEEEIEKVVEKAHQKFGESGRRKP